MKLRAMVIDDSKVMRTMVMESLKKTGLAEFDFTEAGDGQDALGKFHPKKIDIVFADWNMPNMSGVDFVREVRAMDKTDHIPIVMVTSEKTIAKMEEALDEAGANAFISKPFTVDYLIQKLGPVFDELEEQKKGSGGGLFNKLVGG
ncbi:MAG: response regulator [Candidatus Eisenbacteria bacterium]|nr:response regulator [Candidatus Eisenbacteria bacterium]